MSRAGIRRTEAQSIRALAIVCVRDEEIHIRRCIRSLIDEGLDVVLIDHESTDDTVEIAREFLGSGLLAIERMPWTGEFSMDQQLERKAEILTGLDYDWVVNVDADEWLVTADDGRTLLEGIGDADKSGYNCINFQEFVFVPSPGENFYHPDYARRILRYYHFDIGKRNLMRAWKKSSRLDNRAGAGHTLSGGEVRCYPKDFINRHYIALSEDHARRKYLGRRFSKEERARGWHAGRSLIDEDNVRFPESAPPLRSLDRWDSKEFDRSAPVRTHYWQWGNDNAMPEYPRWSSGLIGKSLQEFSSSSSACVGNVDRVLMLYGGERPGCMVGGWAFDVDAGEAIDRVLLVDDSDTIVGAGNGGFDRLDVPANRPEIACATTGWRALAGSRAGRLAAWGMTRNGQAICYLGSLEL